MSPSICARWARPAATKGHRRPPGEDWGPWWLWAPVRAKRKENSVCSPHMGPHELRAHTHACVCSRA